MHWSLCSSAQNGLWLWFQNEQLKMYKSIFLKVQDSLNSANLSCYKVLTKEILRTPFSSLLKVKPYWTKFLKFWIALYLTIDVFVCFSSVAWCLPPLDSHPSLSQTPSDFQSIGYSLCYGFHNCSVLSSGGSKYFKASLLLLHWEPT